MSYQRQPILGETRDLLATNWDGANVEGIDTDADPPLDLTVHTRGRDAPVSNPQLAIELVDETLTDRRFGGDGSGPVFETGGLIQVACVVGSAERLDDGDIDTDASDVAWKMAQEVRRIWHDEAPTGLTNSGSIEYDQLAPGQTTNLPSAMRESDPATVGFLQELTYEYTDKTP